MWKLIKIIILILVFGFSVLVLWMNLTPGYFRYGKDCRIDYLTDNEANKLLTGLETCSAKAVGNILLNLAKLDFNRGPKILPPANTDNQVESDKASSPPPFVSPDAEVNPISQPVYKYGPEKVAEVVVQDGSYYGPPFDPKLFELKISQSNNLFAKSETVDLKKYLGKRVKIRYREVVGIIMGEQQLVMVDSIGL